MKTNSPKSRLPGRSAYMSRSGPAVNPYAESALRRAVSGRSQQDEGVGESKIEQAVDKAALKAEKHVAKELDVKPSDIDAAVRQAAAEVS